MATPQPRNPEEELNQEVHRQERQLHSNLALLNQLFWLCADEALGEKQWQQRSQLILEQIMQTNPMVAKELHQLIDKGDRKEILVYFEREKDELIQTLSEEIQNRKGVDAKINRGKIEKFPSDS